jgi:protein-S-isoprenylcysteine O-methyltransferase Ste14
VIFGGPGLVIVYLPFTITRWRRVPEAGWLSFLAFFLIALALLPLLESVIRFVRVGRGTLLPMVPTQVLVVSGFYRYVRNPMYVGVLSAIAGEAILFLSWRLAVYWCGVFALFNLFVLFYEEPKLSKTYGPQYEQFCRNVPRWIPRLTPWRPASSPQQA